MPYSPILGPVVALVGGLLFTGGLVGKNGSSSMEVADLTWERAVDQRGSSIEAPTFLVRVHEYDGSVVLRSHDGDLEVRFWTTTEPRFGFPGHAPQADMDLVRGDCDSWPPPELVIDDEHAEYRCEDNDYIERYLAEYSSHGSAVMLARYPQRSESTWNDIVGHMASSIEQVPRYRR